MQTVRYGSEYESDFEEDGQQEAIMEEGDGDYSAEIDPGMEVAGNTGGSIPIVPMSMLETPRQPPDNGQIYQFSQKSSAGLPDSNKTAPPGAESSVPEDAPPPAPPPPSTHSTPHPGTRAATPSAASIATPVRPSDGAPLDMDFTQRKLAAVIQQSIEFTRAASRIQELQEHVDTLSQRLTAAASERDKAEAALIEQAKQHEAATKRLREMYETRLSEAAADYGAQLSEKVREISTLKGRLERLEETKSKLLKSGDGKDVVVSGEEAAALRREAQEQEVLLRGYQQENEAAMKKIKELEGALREATTLHIPTGLTHDISVKASTKEAAARLSEILALQQQLESVREQAETREMEMKATIDKLRAEKRDLEARSAGVDLKAMQEGDLLVAQVRGEMEAMRGQYQGMVAELQAKLSWYIENQELLTKNDALVREQQEVIVTLEARLAEWEGPSSKSTQARIRELQSQVVQLQQALKARVPPNSLAGIIQASKPSLEETAAVQALQQEVAKLRDKLADKDEEYELELRAYQQKYEQLHAQYEERTQKLEAAARPRKKEKELLAQVEEQRAMYTRRIRELEGKLKQAQAGGGGGARGSMSGSGGNRGDGSEELAQAALLRAKEGDIKRLAAELERKTQQVAEMHLRLGEAEAKVLRLNEGLRRSTPSSPHSSLMSPAHSSTPVRFGLAASTDALGAAQQDPARGALVAEQAQLIARLQQQSTALRAECDALRQQLAAARQQAAANPPPAELVAEVEALRRRADAADLALATVQRAHTEAVERCVSQAQEHQRALLHMHDEVAYKEGLRWQERLQAAEADARAAKAQVAALQQEAASTQARLRAGWTPAAAEFAALEARLDKMAQEAAAKDAHWKEALEDARQMYTVQAESARARYEAQLSAKTAEVESFKTQVDSLLAAAKRYMAVPAAAARH